MNEQLPSWIVAMQTFGWGSMVQVLVAALLGGLIGLEREWRGRDAGLRTNMLIAMGACLFTIVSIKGFPLLDSAAKDTARLAAQVVTGIGFLGAGAIIQTRGHAKGMTTAATIWIVAAIGVTVGVEGYALGVFSTVTTVVILRLLRPVSKTIAHHDS
jgi:putative Mg2+ transporter-C (MgtC) family protein